MIYVYNQKENMNLSLRFLSFLFCVTLCNAQVNKEYPDLSNESKQAIGVRGLIGGLCAVGLYASGFWLANNELPKISEHPLAYAITACLGASILALFQYQYVPESQFTYAKKGLIELSNNQFLSILLQAKEHDLIEALKKYFFRTKFPLVIGFEKLSQIWILLESYNEALENVKASYQTCLYLEADDLLEVVSVFQKIVQESILTLKNDPQFIAECNAYSQMAAANAAASAASAAWMQAINSPLQMQSTQINIQRN